MDFRTWKSNPFVGLGLLIVILGAGWLIYRNVKGPGQPTEYSYVLKCRDPDCGRVFVASYPEGEKPPFRCPDCGQKTAYFLLQCRLCRRTFTSFNNPFQRAPYFCRDCEKRTAYPVEPGHVPPEATSPSR